MIGSSVSHYRILEKLGEVRTWRTPACVPKGTSAGRSVFQRVIVMFSIPPPFGGSGEERSL